MVRDVLTGNDVAWNTFQNEDVGVAIDKADDAEISVADVAQADHKALMLRFSISAATAGDTITIKAGDGFRSGLGDLVYSCAGGAAEIVLGPLETARFKIQNTVTDKGKIHIDYAGATLAGKAFAYLIDK